MKKIAPGYYTETRGININGESVEVVVFITRASTHEANWYFEIELNGAIIIPGDDWYSTKKEAIESLNSISIGHSSEYGYFTI